MTDKERQSAIREFDELLKEKKNISCQSELDKLQKEVLIRLQVRYFRTTHDKCDDWDKLQKWIGDGWEEFFKPFQDRADELYQQTKSKRESMDEELQELANSIELWNSNTDASIIYSVSDSSYSTQGFGAITYAKGMAEIRAEECKYLGIDANIETIRESYKDIQLVDFAVWVSLNEPEKEILKYKLNSVPFKETVRFCLQRCLNPRVYWPLPWGYEEKTGLGMRGEDLTV
jgi:hypothetical protein